MPEQHATRCIRKNQTGKVKFFHRVKGWGFIFRDDGKGEVFVRFNDIAGEGYRNLYTGDKVTFDLHVRTDGPKKGQHVAKNVRVVKRAEAEEAVAEVASCQPS